jgi:hypothetical protein
MLLRFSLTYDVPFVFLLFIFCRRFIFYLCYLYLFSPAKEYSTHSNGLEVYMECVVLLCSMVIKESLKIPKGYSEAVNRQIIFYFMLFVLIFNSMMFVSLNSKKRMLLVVQELHTFTELLGSSRYLLLNH